MERAYFILIIPVQCLNKKMYFIFNVEDRLTVLWDIKSISIIFYLHSSVYLSLSKANACDGSLKKNVEVTITRAVNNILIGLECRGLIFFCLSFIY